MVSSYDYEVVLIYYMWFFVVNLSDLFLFESFILVNFLLGNMDKVVLIVW